MVKKTKKCTICGKKFSIQFTEDSNNSNNDSKQDLCLTCKCDSAKDKRIKQAKFLKKCKNCKQNIKSNSFNKCLMCFKFYHKSCHNFLNKYQIDFGSFCLYCAKIVNLVRGYNDKIFNEVTNHSYIYHFESDRLNISYPTPTQIETFNTSFSLAMKMKQLAYTNENIYTIKKPYFKSIETLNENDKNIVNRFKENNSKGIYAPLEICYNVDEEFTVQATAFIKKKSLLSEYCGEIKLFSTVRYSSSNGLFTLRYSKNEFEELIIDPDSKCNLGRFFNCSTNGNAVAEIFYINNEPRVFIISKRDIKKGEKIYYDYNGKRDDYYL